MLGRFWLGIPNGIIDDDTDSEVKIGHWLNTDSDSDGDIGVWLNEDINFWLKLTNFW